MGAGPVPPGLLVTPALLARYNVPSLFLAQFAPRAFQFQISTGGPLGTMAFQWKRPIDTAWSVAIGSSTFTPWLWTIDEVFADLAFAPGTYAAGATYSVDVNGNISLSNGAIAGSATASLYDRRLNACSAVSTQALQLMRNSIKGPLMSWGDDTTTHAAAWVYAILKRGVGATPEGAGDGDANVFAAEKMAIEFFASIGKNGRPDSMTDSSVSPDGPMLAAYPRSRKPRQW